MVNSRFLLAITGIIESEMRGLFRLNRRPQLAIHPTDRIGIGTI